MAAFQPFASTPPRYSGSVRGKPKRRNTLTNERYIREWLEHHAGVADRVTFSVSDASDSATADGYDLVTIFEALHDMSVISCLPSAMGDPLSAATGAVMRPLHVASIRRPGAQRCRRPSPAAHDELTDEHRVTLPPAESPTYPDGRRSIGPSPPGWAGGTTTPGRCEPTQLVIAGSTSTVASQLSVMIDDSSAATTR